MTLQSFHLELSFSAENGKTTVLLGESGAGKSTVLQLLAGLSKPQRGLIVLNGITYVDSEHNIYRSPQQRPFGYVFQDYALFPHLNVWENICFGLRSQHLPNGQIKSTVGEALEQVRLTGYEKRRPAQLSGGQQQRVAIARALVLKPELLLLDEPLAALDVQTRREIRQELRQLLRETGITTVMVTHNYLDALVFGEQILVLEQGRLLQQGGQQDLLRYPRSSYVAELVGMNFFQGKLHERQSRLARIELEAGEVEVQAMLEEEQGQPGQQISVVVDPRSITLHREGPEGSARNSFQGKILQILPIEQDQGRVRVSLIQELGGLQLTAEITANSAAEMDLMEGQSIYASFKASEARAYL